MRDNVYKLFMRDNEPGRIEEYINGMAGYPHQIRPFADGEMIFYIQLEGIRFHPVDGFTHQQGTAVCGHVMKPGDGKWGLTSFLRTSANKSFGVEMAAKMMPPFLVTRMASSMAFCLSFTV